MCSGLRKQNLVSGDCRRGSVDRIRLPTDRGKTVTKRFKLSGLGLLLSEKQIPQVVEHLGSGDKRMEALETVALRVKQTL